MGTGDTLLSVPRRISVNRLSNNLAQRVKGGWRGRGGGAWVAAGADRFSP